MRRKRLSQRSTRYQEKHDQVKARVSQEARMDNAQAQDVADGTFLEPHGKKRRMEPMSNDKIHVSDLRRNDAFRKSVLDRENILARTITSRLESGDALSATVDMLLACGCCSDSQHRLVQGVAARADEVTRGLQVHRETVHTALDEREFGVSSCADARTLLLLREDEERLNAEVSRVMQKADETLDAAEMAAADGLRRIVTQVIDGNMSSTGGHAGERCACAATAAPVLFHKLVNACEHEMASASLRMLHDANEATEGVFPESQQRSPLFRSFLQMAAVCRREVVATCKHLALQRLRAMESSVEEVMYAVDRKLVQMQMLSDCPPSSSPRGEERDEQRSHSDDVEMRTGSSYTCSRVVWQILKQARSSFCFVHEDLETCIEQVFEICSHWLSASFRLLELQYESSPASVSLANLVKKSRSARKAQLQLMASLRESLVKNLKARASIMRTRVEAVHSEILPFHACGTCTPVDECCMPLGEEELGQLRRCGAVDEDEARSPWDSSDIDRLDALTAAHAQHLFVHCAYMHALDARVWATYSLLTSPSTPLPRFVVRIDGEEDAAAVRDRALKQLRVACDSLLERAHASTMQSISPTCSAASGSNGACVASSASTDAPRALSVLNDTRVVFEFDDDDPEEQIEADRVLASIMQRQEEVDADGHSAEEEEGGVQQRVESFSAGAPSTSFGCAPGDGARRHSAPQAHRSLVPPVEVAYEVGDEESSWNAFGGGDDALLSSAHTTETADPGQQRVSSLLAMLRAAHDYDPGTPDGRCCSMTHIYDEVTKPAHLEDQESWDFPYAEMQKVELRSTLAEIDPRAPQQPWRVSCNGDALLVQMLRSCGRTILECVPPSLHEGEIVLDDVQRLLVYTLSTPSSSSVSSEKKSATRTVRVKNTLKRLACTVTYQPPAKCGELRLLVSGAGQGKTLASVLAALRCILCTEVIDELRKKVASWKRVSETASASCFTVRWNEDEPPFSVARVAAIFVDANCLQKTLKVAHAVAREMSVFFGSGAPVKIIVDHGRHAHGGTKALVDAVEFSTCKDTPVLYISANDIHDQLHALAVDCAEQYLACAVYDDCKWSHCGITERAHASTVAGPEIVVARTLRELETNMCFKKNHPLMRVLMSSGASIISSGASVISSGASEKQQAIRMAIVRACTAPPTLLKALMLSASKRSLEALTFHSLVYRRVLQSSFDAHADDLKRSEKSSNFFLTAATALRTESAENFWLRALLPLLGGGGACSPSEELVDIVHSDKRFRLLQALARINAFPSTHYASIMLARSGWPCFVLFSEADMYTSCCTRPICSAALRRLGKCPLCNVVRTNTPVSVHLPQLPLTIRDGLASFLVVECAARTHQRMKLVENADDSLMKNLLERQKHAKFVDPLSYALLHRKFLDGRVDFMRRVDTLHAVPRGDGFHLAYTLQNVLFFAIGACVADAAVRLKRSARILVLLSEATDLSSSDGLSSQMFDILQSDMGLSLVDSNTYSKAPVVARDGCTSPMLLAVYPRHNRIDADLGCTTHVLAVECEHVLRKLQAIVQQIIVARSPAAQHDASRVPNAADTHTKKKLKRHLEVLLLKSRPNL